MANYVTAFEITDNECYVIQVRNQKNHLGVEQFFTVPFPQSPPDAKPETVTRAKSDALKAALKSRKLQVGECILVLPKNFVTVLHVFLPSVDDQELVEMVRFEAQKHIHFNVERHIITHHVLSKEGVTGSHVLISTADAPVVEEPLSILTGAGLHPFSATVSSVGLFNLFKRLAPNIPEDQTATLLHIGAWSIEMALIHKNMLIFTRSTTNGLLKLITDWNAAAPSGHTLSMENLDALNIAESESVPGAEDPDRKEGVHAPAILEQWKEKLLHSIRTTYDFARREFDLPPASRMFVSGEGTRFSGISDFLTGKMSMDVQMLDLSQALPGADQVPSMWAPALGAALEPFTPGAVSINLLPGAFVEGKKSRERRQTLFSLAMMIAGVLILGAMYVRAWTVRQERLVNWYETEIKTSGPEVEELKDMQKKIKIIKNYVHDRRNALAILNSISAFDYLPSKVTITDFKYVKDVSVEISGYAFTIKDLNQFISDLEKTGYFKDVTIKQRPWRSLPNNRQPQVLNYTLICQL